MFKKLSLRILTPTVLVVVVVISLSGWSVGRVIAANVKKHASQDLEEQISRTMATLTVVDALRIEMVRASMKVLIHEAESTGKPGVQGKALLKGREVPDLRMGSSSLVGQSAVVDQVMSLTGTTATLFVKSGEQLISVQSNVLMPDGTRAVGTEFDERDRVYLELRAGRSYSGIHEIFGKSYMTEYDLIRDRTGRVIGAWYVGSEMRSMEAVGREIEAAKVLEHGFIALVRPTGEILFKSSDATEDEVLSRLGQPVGERWTVIERRFEPWNYTLIAAYPNADVTLRTHRIRVLTASWGVLVCLLVVMAQYLLISRLVLRPLALLAIRMKNADMNTPLKENRTDEIGVLARAFDGLVTRVRDALLEVGTTSGDVVHTSERISAGAKHVANSVSTQKDQVSQIADLLQEMSAMVVDVADHCEHTTVSAGMTADAARGGGRLVEDALVHMRDLAEHVTAASRRIEGLGLRSEKIGLIVGVINEIAEQTNLLALNAAIEAARAGEQGRGFAVVAAEVRRLAERTTEATRDIADRVEGIQTETRGVVGNIQEGKRRVDEGLVMTEETGASLRRIVGDAERVGLMVKQMATLATQHVAATDKVSRKIEQVNLFAGESAEGARQSAEACAELTAVAGRLQELVGRFRLGV